MQDFDKHSDMTWAWRYYEEGRLYNNRLVPNQYQLVNTNYEFYTGNQWSMLPQTAAMQRLSKPTFNIIKRVTQLFIASLTSSGVTINFEPLAYYDGENMADPETNASVYATAAVKNLLEKFKMEYRLREALTDGAVTGDYCAHFLFNPEVMPYGGAFGAHKGELEMELVDGINVMFGNPSVRDAQAQPYIIIVGRDTVENLIAEAEYYRNKNKDSYLSAADGNLQPDSEYMDMPGVGGQIEINADDKSGKCLYCYLYTKVSKDEEVKDENGLPIMETVLDENGEPIPEKDKSGKPIMDIHGMPVFKTRPLKRRVESVHVTKSTRSCIIYEDIDTGMSLYPIAWGNWEKQKNQYHGRALVTGIVPNQIFLNTMFATVMRHLQLLGFPKTVYNADFVRDWSNEVGEAIGVRGLPPGQNVSTVAFNLQPADMSNQIITTIDKTMQYTKECLGATDAQMGNMKAENTSALMVMQSASEVPLENIRAAYNEWMEDIGAILLDMMGTYYGKRPMVREREFTEPVIDPNTGAPRIDPMTGMMMTQQVKRKIVEEFDFSQFKHLWFNVHVNAGATTYYSEIAMVQTLDNLRRDGTLDVIDYLERLPDKLLPRKDELVAKMREAMGVPETYNANNSQAAPRQGSSPTALSAASVPRPTPPATSRAGTGKTNPSMGGPLSDDKVMQSLPVQQQLAYPAMPPTAQNALKRMAQMRM